MYSSGETIHTDQKCFESKICVEIFENISANVENKKFVTFRFYLQILQKNTKFSLQC